MSGVLFIFGTFQPNFITFFKNSKILQLSSFGFGLVVVECIFVFVVTIVAIVVVAGICSELNPFPIIVFPELDEFAKSFRIVSVGVGSK